MAKNPGKKFEDNIKQSCNKKDIFFYRIKDVYIPYHIPQKLRQQIKVPINEYDNFIFGKGHLFPCELKSTGQKSFSFDEKIIKNHQINNLLKASQYEQIIPGFIFNFRNYENKTYFIHINDFVDFKNKAERKSIPMDICEEFGIEIENEIKKTNYFYYIEEFINKAIEKYN